ncbi:MAG: porphobilinogen synthase [Desulfurococcales archaeon]|nr:porphobilinogen synthase [Desulfurococcales archaeon]
MKRLVHRPRRLRYLKPVRDLVAETRLDPTSMVFPIFVKEGVKDREPAKGLEGHYYYSPNSGSMIKEVSRAMELGVKSFLLFGVPGMRDNIGSRAFDPGGPVQEALRFIRRELGWEPVVFTDVCICGYTDHGHCGIVVETKRGPIVDNDSTLDVYAKIAVSHAEAGADFVAPSGMMDGQVAAIREALDREGYSNVGIMAYSVKYASSFYGPFRLVAGSAPRFGDRRGYQMDPRNSREALKEAMRDVDEGADIIMVKPALAYLDVISLLKERLPGIPLAAYNVSGEYMLLKAGARAGVLDEELALMETLTSIKRAGADIIITYHALEAAEMIRRGYNPF